MRIERWGRDPAAPCRRQPGAGARLAAGGGRVVLRAEPVDPDAVARRRRRSARPPGAEELRLAIERMRFALGVDDDLGEFYRRFRRDPLLGPRIRRRPHLRPQRRPWPWEALAWAVVKQLIEVVARHRSSAASSAAGAGAWRRARRAARRPRSGDDRRPGAGRTGVDGTLGGPIDRAAGGGQGHRGRPLRSREPVADARLLRVPEIGPWTVQCLGLFGRGEPDSLPPAI